MNVTCDSHSNRSHSQCCVWINQDVCEPLVWKEINIYLYKTKVTTIIKEAEKCQAEEAKPDWPASCGESMTWPVRNPRWWHCRSTKAANPATLHHQGTVPHFYFLQQHSKCPFWSREQWLENRLQHQHHLFFSSWSEKQRRRKRKHTHTHKTTRNKIKSRFNLKGNQTEDGSWSGHADMHNSFFLLHLSGCKILVGFAGLAVVSEPSFAVPAFQ